jgi:CheY-like chemotaxis protein
MLVPPGLEIEVTSDERTPDVEIVPDVLGTVLDDLLQAVVPCATAPARLRVQAKGAALDGGVASEPAGLKRGRYARLTIEVERTTLRAAGPAVVAGRKLERALAVVKAHGGYLELRQDPGAPAPCSVDVFLPAAAPRPAAAAGGRARTVLLVDDDAGVRQVTLEMLKTIGIEPSAASSGEEALELYRAGCRYDLVLLDLSMGAGMSGRAAYGELKQIDPEAAVLLVSGSVTAPTLRALLERGLLGFLPKPFGMRQLVCAVQAALGS